MQSVKVLLVSCLVTLSVRAEIDPSIAASVVQVQARPPGGGRVFMGSGVVVGKQLVATNCHVVGHADLVWVRKQGVRLAATNQRADVKRDLCLLDVPGLAAPEARLGNVNRLKPGEKLYLLGFPRALGLSWSVGSVQSLHAYRNGKVIETSADFVEGASGGGMFNEGSLLVGIATFFSAGTDRHYFAIPVDWIPIVSRLGRRAIEPFDGLPFWQDVSKLPGFLRRPSGNDHK